ncbi:MAG: EAL domain-containing protein, partial [Huintestinicola sp.]
DPRLWMILCNTVKMLKDMEMEIVVEGVETRELAGKLSDLGCEYIQGYYYSRPVPEKDFVEFIKSSANCA